MVRLEVEINSSHAEDSSDIVLYSEFESEDDLKKYQIDPEHKAVMPFVGEAREERRMVDYKA